MLDLIVDYRAIMPDMLPPDMALPKALRDRRDLCRSISSPLRRPRFRLYMYLCYNVNYEMLIHAY